MSPHGLVLFASLLAAGTGKLLFPQSTIRVVAAVILGLPLALMAILGEPPSLLGLMIIAPVAGLGAAGGVALAKLVARMRRQG